MTSLLRIIFPNFNAPATVEGAGIRPAATPNMTAQEMGARVVRLFKMAEEKARCN